MYTYYLGIGSNQGDRFAALCTAFDKLFALSSTRSLHSSSVYETSAMYYAKQPDFLNAVYECISSLDPFALFHHCKHIEKAFGRKKNFRNGPRPLDIDILLLGNAIIRTPVLTIPHIRCIERRFVLEPLLELNPNLVHPFEKKPFSVFWKKIGVQSITRTTYSIGSNSQAVS